ncbi:MAG: hypothetical protein RIQ46_261 [Pseudomonadota bacterium]
MPAIRRFFPIMLAALPLAACQQAKEEAPAAEPAVEAQTGMVVVNGRLVLPAVKGNPAAAYFDLANKGTAADTLAGVFIEGAETAEMHETTPDGMGPVDKLEVAPGQSVSFAPGGKHVMAFKLADTVQAGGTVEMTLTFADGDKISAPLKVEPAGGGMAGGMDAEHSGH